MGYGISDFFQKEAQGAYDRIMRKILKTNPSLTVTDLSTPFVQAGLVREGLRCRLHIPKKIYRPGEDIEISFYIHNGSEKTKDLTYPSDPRCKAAVFCKGGLIATLKPMEEPEPVENLQLKPGESVKYSWIWNQTVSRNQVAGGLYQISVHHRAPALPAKLCVQVWIKPKRVDIKKST
jgi:hypothetical protein